MVDRGCLDMNNKNMGLVDERILAHAPVEKMTPLPVEFQPSNYDVICGRGKSCFNHIGNRRFRVTIDMNLSRYASASSKLEKSLIVMSIVDTVRDNSPRGGFVKHVVRTSRWYEVGDHLAREKVGQALREALVAKDPQKREAKKQKRTQAKTNSSKALPVVAVAPSSSTVKQDDAAKDFVVSKLFTDKDFMSYLSQDDLLQQLFKGDDFTPRPIKSVQQTRPQTFSNRAA
jgi:hypothetical protein|mmetsp:Transcript_3628/g.4339  ORF Transcript_3628/g.4339 Transcript_3628/m.4339 type:complete len:230 (-) Transcript_3628:51-740(-)|eukprot:CAMPEP_0195290888 /NCGR_PEP_ID=MMETSP0707-20130614/6571_1 /TAXON_ID=33640 /ORGANISM="Asterionellopsis glacialis, Strain CCMP134" /LENGTH=229 /DNA_ID=CAMNT_0040351069 /DNA_START=118 /DNA_END=807 /DNA_ORIENTATION=+